MLKLKRNFLLLIVCVVFSACKEPTKVSVIPLPDDYAGDDVDPPPPPPSEDFVLQERSSHS